jgi:D-3-phosphoglycerate dehydrogenase
MKISYIEDTGIPMDEVRAALQGHEIVDFDTRSWTDEKLISELATADILALTNRPISARVIESLPHLKMISVAFAGIDHIDQEAAGSRKIVVKNAGGYANVAVAELVFGLMISLARNIPENNRRIRCGGMTNTGSELRGKTLGIIGHGAIGREVERLAIAFGMTPLLFDRDVRTSLETVFSTSDFVTLHVPLLPATRGMISTDVLKLMKPTSFLINCARGPIVDGEALRKALDEGVLAGAALDVFDVEPPLPGDDPLLQCGSVIATPHIGFNTQEALVAKGRMALKNIEDFLAQWSR